MFSAGQDFPPWGREQGERGCSERGGGGREGGRHQLEVRGVLGVGSSGNLQGTEVHHCHFCLEIWRGGGKKLSHLTGK